MYSHPTYSSSETGTQKQGFALILTIVLVAFLVLVVVGLGVFTRVETTVAGNSQKLNAARQNALMGLNIAIGELQEFAGPDQRVTARADITAAGLNQPYLTGVWDATVTPPAPLTWLVSGNEGINPLSILPTDPALDTSGDTAPLTLSVDDVANTVFLVGSNTVDDTIAANRGSRIKLSKRPITANAASIPGAPAGPAVTIGHYAYWVGDESIKANVAQPNPANLSTPALSSGTWATPTYGEWAGATNLNRIGQQILPRPKLESLFALTPDVNTTADEINRLVSPAQLSFLPFTAAIPATPKLYQTHFHSLTTYSQGVLANVATGRLRSDLSDHDGPLAEPVAGLFGYMRLRADSETAAFVAQYVLDETEPFIPAPILTEFGIKLNFYVNTADGNRVYVNFTPYIELWNPYAADLRIQPNTVATGVLTISVKNLPNVSIASVPASVAGTFQIPDLVISIKNALDLPAGTILASPPGGAVIAEVATPFVAADPNARLDVANLATTLSIELSVGSTLVNTYAPAAFLETPVSSNSPSDPDDYMFGYGFQLDGNITALTSTNDPRTNPLFVVGNWVDSPNINAGRGIGDGGFNDTQQTVLYDLPRQEIQSLGELRLAPLDAVPYSLGTANVLSNYFDQYFVSTVPRAAWNFDQAPIPNRYLRLHRSDAFNALNNAAQLAELQNGTTAARDLLISGSFNINSTSVAAWRLVLGANLEDWKPAVDLQHTFFRLHHGAQQTANAPLTAPDLANTTLAVNTGGRRLTDDAEVNLLATGIVRELKALTVPFVSLQEFVDSGLVAAVINDPDGDGSNADSLNDALGPDHKTSPAALLQADVIALIAPFMAVRGDTFLVRSYGEVNNPVTGVPEGRAWCEAVVQRVPQLTAPVVGSYTAGDEDMPPIGTYPFGRKFKIISFRWLTSSDI